MTGKRAIVLTGATGGIGRALVFEMAQPDTVFFLAGRDRHRLKEVATLAEERGASFVLCDIPLTERVAFLEALKKFDDAHPIDILLSAAGVKTGNVAGSEPPTQVDRVVQVNLTATIHIVQVVVSRMIERRKGQIVLFSSLAAISPHADLLSYSASKAGVRAYGMALRKAVSGTGVSVSVVTPGYIATPMTDRHIGPTPQKISAERAAKLIVRGLDARRPYITFPGLLTVLVRLKAMLPVRLQDLIDRGHRAQILPDQDELLCSEKERLK